MPFAKSIFSEATTVGHDNPFAHRSVTRVLVAQLGARMHYAVPRILHASGMLELLVTDLCAGTGALSLARHLPPFLLPGELSRLVSRIPDGIPKRRIAPQTLLGVEYLRRRRQAIHPSQATAAHLWAGGAFCRQIVRRGLRGANTTYTFNTAGLELLEFARAQNATTLHEQTIAPKRIEQKILAEEHERHPDWEPMPTRDAWMMDYIAREEEEWKHASVILCGSHFVVDGIARCGGPAEKCVVIPYGVDSGFQHPPRTRRDGKLRVLTVGAVSLRKGSPYVYKAAKALRSIAEFRMVGPISLNSAKARQLRDVLDLRGSVPRSRIREHYEWADVFLLPSLCEGSATVSYEALSTGLPIIATPNTGTVMRHGIEGWLVEAGKTALVVAALEKLARDPDQREQMSVAAAQRGAECGLTSYATALTCLVNSCVKGS